MTDRAGVTWGFLSTARINDVVLRAVADSASVRVLAVAGRDQARARRWAEQRGIPRAYGAYEALLADPDIDAIYLSVPNSLHVFWAKQALLAGKHVLCEKPVGIDPGKVEELEDLAQSQALVFAEAFMYRYHPQTDLARKLVREGAIGPVRHISAVLSFRLESATDPRLDPDLGGGALMDVGCYCVSALRLFGGEPTVITAELSGGDRVDMRISACLHLENGITGQLHAAMDLPRRDRLEVVGEEGIVTLDDPWHCRLPSIALRRPSGSSPGPSHPGDGLEQITIEGDGARRPTGDLHDAYRFELEAVSAAIAGGRQPEFGGADAVLQATALAAVKEAASAGHETKPERAEG